MNVFSAAKGWGKLKNMESRLIYTLALIEEGLGMDDPLSHALMVTKAGWDEKDVGELADFLQLNTRIAHFSDRLDMLIADRSNVDEWRDLINPGLWPFLEPIAGSIDICKLAKYYYTHNDPITADWNGLDALHGRVSVFVERLLSNASSNGIGVSSKQIWALCERSAYEDYTTFQLEKYYMVPSGDDREEIYFATHVLTNFLDPLFDTDGLHFRSRYTKHYDVDTTCHAIMRSDIEF